MCGDKFMSDCFHTAGSASLPAHEQPSIGSLWREKAARCLGFRLIRRTSACPRFRGGVNKVSARSCVVGLVNEQTVGDGTGGGWGWSAGGVGGWVGGLIAGGGGGGVFTCLVLNGAVGGGGMGWGCLPVSCLQSWGWRARGGGGGGGGGGAAAMAGGLSGFCLLPLDLGMVQWWGGGWRGVSSSILSLELGMAQGGGESNGGGGGSSRVLSLFSRFENGAVGEGGREWRGCLPVSCL